MDEQELGWEVFSRRLARYLAWMHDDDTMVLEVGVDEPDDGAPPYVQFAEFGPGMVRAEVSSNTYLAPEHRTGEGQEFLLRRLGWQLETGGNWWIHAAQADVDGLAQTVVRVLREVFGVRSRRDLLASEKVMMTLGISRVGTLLDGEDR